MSVTNAPENAHHATTFKHSPNWLTLILEFRNRLPKLFGISRRDISPGFFKCEALSWLMIPWLLILDLRTRCRLDKSIICGNLLKELVDINEFDFWNDFVVESWKMF